MTPLARTTDPITSHQAAAKTDFKARHIAKIYAALKEKGPMTKDEIADSTGLDHVAVARRMAAMEDKGLVRRTILTRPSRTGRECTVWKAI